MYLICNHSYYCYGMSAFCVFRLWGDHGQAALEGAKICLINASATGTEILKNLILPGIKIFHTCSVSTIL